MPADRKIAPSLGAQAFWLLLAKTCGFVLTLGLPLVLVRALSQTEFGLYKQAFLLVGTATTMLPLGFGMSAFYFLPREREAHGAIVLHILLVHASVGALAASALVLWPGVLTAVLGSDALAPYAAELGAVIVAWTVASFLEIVAVARQDVAASTFFIVASQASKTAIFIGAAMAAGSVRALIDVAILQGVAQIGMLLVYLRRTFPGFWRTFDWPTLRTQASYALPLGLSGLVLKLQSDLPHYFVAHAFGASGYAIFTVGVFNLPLIGLLRESVGSVMLPRVSRLEQAQARDEIVTLVARVARKLALFYFPLFAFLVVVAREFITVLFTRQYLASWPIFSVYLLVIPFGVIVLDPITRAYAGQRFFLLKLRLALCAATVAILAIGANRLGLLGIVAMMVAVQIAGTLGAAVRLSQVMGLRRRDFSQFAPLGRIAAASFAAGAACAAARFALAPYGAFVTLIVTAIVYAFAYGAAILSAGILEGSEWLRLRQLFRWQLPLPRRKVPC